MSKQATFGAGLRNTLGVLAIGVLWGFFAVLCVMMASMDEFTRGARVGLYIGAALCTLFGVLSLGSWLYRLASVLMGRPDAAQQRSGDDGGQVHFLYSVDREYPVLELSDDSDDDSGNDFLEIRDGHTDTAEEQCDARSPTISVSDDVKELGVVFRSVMTVLQYVPATTFLIMSVPAFVLLLLGSARALAAWTGLAKPEDLGTDHLGHAGFVGVLLLTCVFVWRGRSDLPADHENWYWLQNAAMLLLASEVKALAVALGLGIVGFLGLVLGSLAGLL